MRGKEDPGRLPSSLCRGQQLQQLLHLLCGSSSHHTAPPSGVLALAAWPGFLLVAQTPNHGNINPSLYSSPHSSGIIFLLRLITGVPSLSFWLFSSSITHVTPCIIVPQFKIWRVFCFSDGAVMATHRIRFPGSSS